MKFVNKSAGKSVGINMRVSDKLLEAIPVSVKFSGAVLGRIKGTGLSFKGIEQMVLLTTPSEAIVYGTDGQEKWRKPLMGMIAENQSLDAVRFIASDGDEIKFVTGAPSRSKIIAHIVASVDFASQESPEEEVGLLAIYDGGTGYSLPTGTILSLREYSEGIAIDNLTDGSVIQLSISEIDDLEFSGGKSTSGGGFFGGGYGVEGFAVGLAAATVLNKLTTRSQVSTSIRILTGVGELNLVTNQATPEELDLSFASTRTQLRQKAKNSSSTPSAAPSSLAEEIAQLSSLRDAGVLSDDEFQAAKTKLLS